VDVNFYSENLATGASEVMALVQDYEFPEGYRYNEGGMYESMTSSFRDLALALLAAIGLVFMVMAAQFESLLLSFIVMLSVPFAMSGAFLALFLTGKTLSVTSFVGLIMLVGIVVNSAILLVEFIKINREEGMERNEAIAQAGKYRLRPILMTGLTTIFGMIPMSLGRGDGGEILAPLAISVMGGLVGSTLVTLILIPTFYALVDDRRQRKEAKKAEKAARIAALEEKWREEDAALEK
jgi:HAE1 family hydrophobic/amphiphilic exporter-1